MSNLLLEIQKGTEEKLKDRFIQSANRCSSFTGCPKKAWFQNHKVQSFEKPRYTQDSIFAMGDLTELFMISEIMNYCVGKDKTYKSVDFGKEILTFELNGRTLKLFEQIKCKFIYDNILITGHPDGLGLRNSDNQWELIEIKSFSSWGFNNFKKLGPGNYIFQAHALMMTDELKTLNVKSVRFYGMRKDNSEKWVSYHEYDKSLIENVKRKIRIANKELEPENQYSADQFPCTICEYRKLCHN